MELEFLEVKVAGDVDVRGTMMVDRTVPVGFLEMRCDVQMQAKAGTNPRLLGQLKVAAEQSCVVLQTLRAPLHVEVCFDSGGGSFATPSGRRPRIMAAEAPT